MFSWKWNQSVAQAAVTARRIVLVGCGLGLLSVGHGALAQSSVAPPASTLSAKRSVTVKLTQHKVLLENGVERMVDASSVRPGDVIEYSATYTNTGPKAVTGLQGDLPIPEGLDYVPLSAKPGVSKVKFATQDGVYGSEPLLRQVAGKMVPVPYAEYRALRWNLGQLAPGAAIVVSARAKVETTPAPLATAAVPAR